MLAFIQLSPSAVKVLMNLIKDFKRKLINQESFKTRITSNPFRDAANLDSANNYRKDNKQIIKYTQTKARYYNFTIKVALYSMILFSILVWNFVSAQASSDVIYRRQNQLQVANYISEKSIMSYAAYTEMFATNNTDFLVEHSLPLTALREQLEALKRIQNQATETFLELDRTYDPQIQKKIFENNNCEEFTNALYYSQCQKLSLKGYRISLLSLMAFYSQIMEIQIQEYISSNKSTPVIIASIGLKTLDQVGAASVLISHLAQSMAKIIDVSLTTRISEANNQRSTILIIFSISLLVISFLFWFQILIKLQKVEANFKKVVQIFPSNLVLSNLQLNNFLIKGSNLA